MEGGGQRSLVERRDRRWTTFALSSYPVRVQPSIASIRQRPSFIRHARPRPGFTRLVRAPAGLDRPGCGSASLASPGPRPGITLLSRAAAGLHAGRPSPRFT